MAAWFGLSHQILSANKNPGFGHAAVEPTTIVKQCDLQILHSAASFGETTTEVSLKKKKAGLAPGEVIRPSLNLKGT
jgi:hypothetical protein